MHEGMIDRDTYIYIYIYMYIYICIYVYIYIYNSEMNYIDWSPICIYVYIAAAIVWQGQGPCIQETRQGQGPLWPAWDSVGSGKGTCI
jgi:hypothetical protein